MMDNTIPAIPTDIPMTTFEVALISKNVPLLKTTLNVYLPEHTIVHTLGLALN